MEWQPFEVQFTHRALSRGNEKTKKFRLKEEEALKVAPGMVAYDYNPDPWKTEARGSLVNSRPG